MLTQRGDSGVFCSQCGKQLAANAQFCESCGTKVAGSAGKPKATRPARAATPTAQETQASAVRLPSFISRFFDALLSPEAILSNWRDPAIGAGVAIALGLLVCIGVSALLGVVVTDEAIGRLLPVVQGGGLLFYLFQRVSLRFEAEAQTSSEFGDTGLGEGALRLVFSPLGGLLLVGAAIMVGAFIAAQRQGGSDRDRVLAGVRLALPFALLSFITSFLIPIRSVSDTGEVGIGVPISVRPSHIGAFFVPLVWGAVFGAVGAGLQVYGRRRLLERTRALVDKRFRNWSGVIRGTLKGLGVGLAALFLLGILLIVVQTVRHSSDVADIFRQGRGVLALLMVIVLGLAHLLATGLLASLGIPFSLHMVGESGSTQTSVSIFGGPGEFPPRWFLLLLLVGVISSLGAGYFSAREAEPNGRAALRAGLQAGIPFVLICWLLAWLVGGTITVQEFSPLGIVNSGGGIGPHVAAGLLLPIVWGFAGGWLGALVYVQRFGMVKPASLPTTEVSPSPVSSTDRSTQVAPEGESRFCTQCGAKNPISNKFCESCGKTLE